jgi:hypothetical protein
MPFHIDVFISYGHPDDQPLAGAVPWWVSDFYEALNERLGEMLGKPPRIWLDPKVRGSDVFADELRTAPFAQRHHKPSRLGKWVAAGAKTLTAFLGGGVRDGGGSIGDILCNAGG